MFDHASKKGEGEVLNLATCVSSEIHIDQGRLQAAFFS
jgi:hypothetical protein